MRIGIANDHASVEMKKELVAYHKVMRLLTMVQIYLKAQIILSGVKRYQWLL